MNPESVNTPAALPIRLSRLALRRQIGELDEALYAAAYFLTWQMALHGRRFASRKSKSESKPDPEAWSAMLDTRSGEPLRTILSHWFERHHFLGVIPNVPAAFLGWLKGLWSLQLSQRIPSPAEVLRMQAAGTRPVTVLADYSRAVRPVLGKADGFAFLIHDLEHAYKFFHDPELHAAQRRFFRLLLAAVEAGWFEAYRADPVFAGKFDYLISDMNTHPVHGLRYLSAVLVECLLRAEGKGPEEALSPQGEAEMSGLLGSLGRFWGFSAPAAERLLRLPGEFGEADAEVLAEAVATAEIDPEPCYVRRDGRLPWAPAGARPEGGV